MRYKPWKPGDPCTSCRRPIHTLEDKFLPHRTLCKRCGNEKQRKKREAAQQKAAVPCTQCQAPMLTWTERRRGTCKACRQSLKCSCGATLLKSDLKFAHCGPCRKVQRTSRVEVRWCACGAEIEAGRRYAKFCLKCANKSRIESAKRGNETMRKKAGNDRPMATHAVQVPMNTGEYRPPLTRAEALAQDVANYDPARAAWIDRVRAKYAAGVQG